MYCISFLNPRSELIRLILLTIPDVTLLTNVNGLPSAITNSPGLTVLESSKIKYFKFVLNRLVSVITVI